MVKNQDEGWSLKGVFKSFKCWSQVFKFIWDIDKLYLVLIFILSVIQGILPSVSIIATQNLINSIQIGASKGNGYILTPFIVLIVVTIGTSLVSQIKGYFESLFQIKLSYKTSLVILEKAITFELKNFEDSKIYDMLRRAESETGNRPYRVFSQILNLIAQIITLLSMATLLIVWKWWIVLVILIVPIISSIYSTKIGNLQYRIQRNRSQKERVSWYLRYVLTNDISFKEIKLYGISNYFLDKFKTLNKEFIAQDKSIMVKRIKVEFAFEVLEQVIGAFILFIIINAAYLGEILIGNTITYISCVSNVQRNTYALLSNLAGMYENNLYINQFFEFLNIPIESKRIENGINIDEIKSIKLRNVSYKYKNREEYAIKNINMNLKLGDKIALVGHNGSGKTTLVKLISGFYDDYEGEIFINGIDLSKINLETYRKKIGTVFQDYSKYELTLRENIGVGDIANIKRDDILLRALSNGDGAEILKSLKDGLESQLGVWFDDGVQLSGGQWQKLALSRAFLRKADIYILDEPSSALDPVSEYNMLCKCYELMKNNIGIFITHRLFNIKRMATKIIVLNDGEIVEEGRHEELLDIDGYYAHLYNIQNEEEESIEKEIADF